MHTYRLCLVLVIQVLGLIGCIAYSVYLMAQPVIGPAGAPPWLLNSSVMYTLVISYWAITLALSVWAWSGRAYLGSPIWRSTQFQPTLILGLMMSLLVAHAFGDFCFTRRGGGEQCRDAIFAPY